MSKPVVFVIGASGNVGSATVRALSSKHSEKVEIRAGVRNPEKAEALKSIPHVTVVRACMGDEGLEGTFSGVDSLFIVTPTAENRASLANSTADAAKKAGVKYIMAVTGPVADYPEMSLGKPLHEIEKHISDLGIPYGFVRLPCFLENLFAVKETVTSQALISFSFTPDVPVSVIAVQDAGNAVATMLVNPSQHHNSTYFIVSDTKSLNDIAREFSYALGKEISYIYQPIEELAKNLKAQGLQEWQLDGMVETVTFLNDQHPAVAPKDTGSYTKITGESPTSVKAWIAKYCAMFK